MTLAPAENWHEVEGATGPPLEPNPICSRPGCGRPSTDGHHIWRRSFTGGPRDWVTIAGRLVANKTWLCVEHHAQVTGGLGGHDAWIQWRDGKYWWYIAEQDSEDVDVPWRCLGPIDPQPKGAAGTLESFDEPIEQPIPDHICPQCGKVHKHRHPKPKESPIEPDGLEHLPARPKTRFQIMVPQDALEDGVEIIETLLDGLRKPLHTEHEKSAYYTLVKALVLLTQHIHLLVDEED